MSTNYAGILYKVKSKQMPPAGTLRGAKRRTRAMATTSRGEQELGGIASEIADRSVSGSYAEAVGRAERVLPGGVLGRHAYPDGVEHIPVSGKGAWIVDHAGRELLDYSCGGGSLILGYSHPAVVRALQEQAERATQFVSILNFPALQLSERIEELVIWPDQVRFALSGAEAVMFALRLSRAATGRDKILKFEGAYHGNSDYALWGTTPREPVPCPAAQPDSAGIPGAIREFVRVAPYNDPETTTSIVDREWRQIAAIIVEPVQRYYAAEPGFLEALRQMCDARGIVLIYDEVVTGFRHALGGAAEVTGIEPDLSVFGKALGGGLPVSAVAGRAAIMAHSDPRRGGPEDGYCYVTSSQAGNPLGCAAALATLKELARPGVMREFHRFAEDLKAGLRDIVRHSGAAAQVVGAGPLWDIVFADGPIRDHGTAARADGARHRRFHLGLVEQGVMVRIGGRSYFSTAHREREVEFTLRAAETALGSASQ